jgi:hypothetical protein
VECYKCSYEYYIFLTLNITTHNYWSKMFVIIYAMDLCNVFHNVKLLLSIPIGEK